MISLKPVKVPFFPGDTLLMCSDGLTDRVDKDQITIILTNHATLRATAASLIDAANDAGGNDNITVVLVKNNTEPLKHTASKPLSRSVPCKSETKEPLQQSQDSPGN